MRKRRSHYTKVVFLSSRNLSGPVAERFFTEEIIVGRSHTDHQNKVDLCLDWDLRVSRRHARLFLKQEQWWIEDLNSKRGTLLDGQEIKERGRQPSRPGSLIRTGETLWTFFPSSWLSVIRDNVLVYGPVESTINYAFQHCGHSLIGELKCLNFGSESSSPFLLRLDVPTLSDALVVSVPTLKPRLSHSVRKDLKLLANVLKSQIEPISVRLRVCIEDEVYHDVCDEITLLGFWDWCHAKRFRPTIAAFVMPRSSLVERIVAQMEGDENLHSRNLIADYLSQGDRNVESRALERVYTFFKERALIAYEAPKCVECESSQETFQTIRPPQAVFAGHPHSWVGRGTCLDLALLVASCLESMDFLPVIVFTGWTDKTPKHAMAGCQVGRSPWGRPVIVDRQDLLSRVEQGELIVVEATGVATGFPGRREKLTFASAIACARSQLKEAPWICAVNIAALREPFARGHSVPPIECSYEPVVAKAFEEAEKTAKRKGGKTVQCSHLLYGVLESAGKVICELCRSIDLDAAACKEALDGSLSRRHALATTGLSANLRACQRLAEDFAREMGSTSVREQDLLWALLLVPSVTLAANSRKAGMDLDAMRQALSRHYPPPPGARFSTPPSSAK